MRSIRLSLILCFVAVLTLALGAVSGLHYQTTRATLQAKEKVTQAAAHARYERRCRTEAEQFDAKILHRAQTLATLARSQWGPHQDPRLYSLGFLSAAPSPQGHLLLPVWLGEAVDGPLARKLRWNASFTIRLPEEALASMTDDDPDDYVQVYGEDGTTLQRSPSMAEHAFTLPPGDRNGLALFAWRFDDVEIKPGVPVRRVTLKTPVAQSRFVIGPPRPRPSSPPERPRPTSADERPPEPPRRPTKPFFDRPSPAIFIQYAAETDGRDRALAGFARDRDRERADLKKESDDTLAALGGLVLGIGLAALAAAALGGCLLIGVGLSPLRRLRDAVSRVSEKDFRLQLDPGRLPIELRPIVDRLRRTLEQLEHAFAREKQAVADISHELRTPVAALLTTLEVALRRPRSPEQYQELLRECHATGEQMSRVVERLLALARMDAGMERLRPQEVDAVDVAEQCVALVRPLAEARELTLRLDAGAPARLTTDPDKLREILTNLLHNAIEYNRPRGRIDVGVARENGHVRLTVRDTGVGMPPQVRAHMFERFYRADDSRHAEGLHAGLGLAIVKGYLDLLGGTIGVESAEGEGSVFRVELPVARG